MNEAPAVATRPAAPAPAAPPAVSFFILPGTSHVL
jgi:hypothetical protein